MVSPLTNGEPRRQYGTCTGAALNQARRAKNTPTPNSHEEGGADSWSWASNLADASATKQPVSAAHLHKHGPALPPHTYGQPPSRHWLVVGPHFLRMRHTPFLQQARPPTTWQPTTTSMGTPASLATSSATPPRHPHQPLGQPSPQKGARGTARGLDLCPAYLETSQYKNSHIYVLCIRETLQYKNQFHRPSVAKGAREKKTVIGFAKPLAGLKRLARFWCLEGGGGARLVQTWVWPFFVHRLAGARNKKIWCWKTPFLVSNFNFLVKSWC